MVDQCPTLEPQGTQLPPGMACGKEQITKKYIHKRFLACLDFNMLLDCLTNLAPFFYQNLWSLARARVYSRV